MPERLALSFRHASSNDVARIVSAHLEDICNREELTRVLAVVQGLYRASDPGAGVHLFVYASRTLLRFEVGQPTASAPPHDAGHGLIRMAAASDRCGILCQPRTLWAEIDLT
jgi:hypothetical protein